MKKIKEMNNNSYLSEILTQESWNTCLDEVSQDLIDDFPNLILENGNNAIEELIKTKTVSKYLLSNILVKYGRQKVIFKVDELVLLEIENILFDWLKNMGLVYNEIINLSPAEILKFSKSQIKTNSTMKTNDSQFHSSIPEEFANEYVNNEQQNISFVEQGNSMNVLKNLIKFGYGYEIESVSKKFASLVGNMWSVNYEFKTNKKGEFEHNE